MYALIDEKSKEYDAREDDIEERLLSSPGMFKTPIVRNGKQATVGYKPDIWKALE